MRRRRGRTTVGLERCAFALVDSPAPPKVPPLQVHAALRASRGLRRTRRPRRVASAARGFEPRTRPAPRGRSIPRWELASTALRPARLAPAAPPAGPDDEPGRARAGPPSPTRPAAGPHEGGSPCGACSPLWPRPGSPRWPAPPALPSSPSRRSTRASSSTTRSSTSPATSSCRATPSERAGCCI